MTSWAKRGVEPITKFEFRVNVRKLMENANAKDADALFDSFDEDRGGTLDIPELRKVLKSLKDAAVGAQREEADTRKLVEQVEERLEQSLEVLAKTRASEEAEVRLEDLRTNKGVGARLGVLLVTRNLKVGDLTLAWDSDGLGEVDRAAFRKNVLSIGLVAEDAEIYELFDSLDTDGGGSLDMNEVKHSLKTLQDAASQVDADIAKLKKSTGELWKIAKTAQVEFKKLQKADEIMEADRKAKKDAREQARIAVEQEKRAAQAKAAARRLEKEEEAKRAYEAKIEARRQLQAEKLQAEMKAFSATSTGTASIGATQSIGGMSDA